MGSGTGGSSSSGSGGGAEDVAASATAVAAAFVEIQGLCDGVGGDLPPGWLSAVDPESGDTYYYDTYTQKTTWFKPKKPSAGSSNGAAESSADESQKAAASASKGRAAENGAAGGADAQSSGGLDPGPSAAGLSRGKGEFGAFEGFGSASHQGRGNLSDLDEFEEAYGGEDDEEETIDFGRSSSQHDALLAEPVTAAALSHLAQAGANAGRAGSAAAAAQVESEEEEDEEISLTVHGPSKGGSTPKSLPTRNAVRALKDFLIYCFL